MRTKIIQIVSGTLGFAHLLVETTADIIVETEVVTIKAISKKDSYSAEKIRKSRHEATLDRQLKTIDSYLKIKQRILNRKHESNVQQQTAQS